MEDVTGIKKQLELIGITRKGGGINMAGVIQEVKKPVHIKCKWKSSQYGTCNRNIDPSETLCANHKDLLTQYSVVGDTNMGCSTKEEKKLVPKSYALLKRIILENGYRNDDDHDNDKVEVLVDGTDFRLEADISSEYCIELVDTKEKYTYGTVKAGIKSTKSLTIIFTKGCPNKPAIVCADIIGENKNVCEECYRKRYNNPRNPNIATIRREFT